MNRPFILVIIFLLTSCSCKYDKADLMNYFSEVEQLNKILIAAENKLELGSHPDSISSKVRASKHLIELLKNKMDLTEIEIYEIDGASKDIGLAYRFGNPKADKCYSFLIFAQKESSLENFSHFEQFSDCAVKSGINNNWSYSLISPNCDN